MWYLQSSGIDQLPIDNYISKIIMSYCRIHRELNFFENTNFLFREGQNLNPNYIISKVILYLIQFLSQSLIVDFCVSDNSLIEQLNEIFFEITFCWGTKFLGGDDHWHFSQKFNEVGNRILLHFHKILVIYLDQFRLYT